LSSIIYIIIIYNNIETVSRTVETLQVTSTSNIVPGIVTNGVA